MTDPNEFIEVYATATGFKQRVPRGWLVDPILSRGIRKTPSQRELDGELPARPREDNLVAEIDEYAEAAGIDFPSGATKTEKLVAVEDVFAFSPVQDGLEVVEPDPPVADPLSPSVVAHVEPTPIPADVDPDSTDDDTPTSTDDTESPDNQTPAAGDEEN